MHKEIDGGQNNVQRGKGKINKCREMGRLAANRRLGLINSRKRPYISTFRLIILIYVSELGYVPNMSKNEQDIRVYQFRA